MFDLTMRHPSNHLNAQFITFVSKFKFLLFSHQSTAQRYQNYIYEKNP